jgi:hypothetical protein
MHEVTEHPYFVITRTHLSYSYKEVMCGCKVRRKYVEHGLTDIQWAHLISAPSVKKKDFLIGCISATYQCFDKPVSFLSSMDPNQTDKIFSFLCQIVFMNFKWSTF